MMALFRKIVAASTFVVSALATVSQAADDASHQFFENKIRPVLVEQCYRCHSAEAVAAGKLKGGLLVDSREALLKGGDTGPAIVPGDPEKSLLMKVISWSDPDLQMPPKKKLADAQIADLSKWVKEGASWPSSPGPATKPASPVAFDLQKRKAEWWCWQPIKRPVLPAVRNDKWSGAPIDRFILAKLEEKNLAPASPADRHALLRRVYFDLIGLPPTPADVEAFVADQRPDAFERVVDRLLASEHFGERWARHWMDLVRYGETRGHEFEPIIPNAWQYRDYLTRAFNANVPYDQFVREHVAGDLLEKPRLNPKTGGNESILATGFWFLGEEVHSPVDIRQDEADRLDNRVDMFGKTFQAVTLGCARCHDHKFDAISTKDYYSITGFLLSAGYRQAAFESMPANQSAAERLEKLRVETRVKLAKALVAARKPAIDRLDDYLLAAREVITGNDSASCENVAQNRGLDRPILTAIVAELTKAKADASHPLHLYAVVAHDKAADQPAAFASRIQAALKKFPAASAESSSQVLLDYTADGPVSRWFTDGFAFGVGPTRAGELILPDAPGAIPTIAEFASARRDLLFQPKLSPGTEVDHGGLGGWQRPGQMVRTNKVTLQSGSLWYLVRGSGHAYAVVDSHLIVAGPLHGRLLRELPSDKPNWRWVQHDLTAYAGHRAHVEFSPAGMGEFEVAKVVESADMPSMPVTNELVRRAATDAGTDSPAVLAKAIQRALASAAERFTARADAKPAVTRDEARFVGWLVSQQSLAAKVDSESVDAILRDYAAARDEIAKGIQQKSASCLAMMEGNGVEERVLVRGQPKLAGDVTPRRYLEAVAGSAQKPYPSDGSGRMRLVDELLADSNPLTARVMVNRVWHHLFGRGIVPTVDNFGVLGQPRSHPELLDYLADNFRHEQKWSVKQLIRSIVLSNTYQMSSRASAEAEQADPQNLLLQHMSIRRLEGEAIRDAVLAVSGRLDETVGGSPVEVHITPFMDGRGKPGGSGPLDGAGRRSLYTRVRRNFMSPMMVAFDMPTPFACVGRRNVSNVPAQALILMNDPFVLEQANLWAKRTLANKELTTPEQRIQSMYMTALGRPAREDELADARQFLQQQAEELRIPDAKRPDDPKVWAEFAHVLLNLKEFVFVR